MRLRARLLLLIGAALLPAGAIQVNAERQARAQREAEQRTEALRLVQMVSADLESVVEGARQFLAAIANLDSVTGDDPGLCHVTLLALRRDVPRYASFSVADQTGRLVCGAAPGTGGQDVSRRSWFRDARASGEFVVGEYAIGMRTGLPSLHFGYPLSASRHGRDGVVTAALDLNWLAGRLAEVPLPPGGTVLVADRSGTVLGRWPEPERFVGQTLEPRLSARLDTANVEVATGPGIDGVRRVYAFSPLGTRPQGLFIGVGIDPAPAEAALAAANRRGILFIAASGLAALGLGLFAARRFLEGPVEALVAGVERWRAGDLSTRVASDPRLGRQGEFARIAAAFDEAAAIVAARETALRESEARFLQIGEALEDALLITEPEEQVVVYASPALARMIGVPAEDMSAGFETLLGAVHPEDRAALEALVTQPAEHAFETEFRLCRPDGAVRRMRHRRFPVPGSGRAVCIISDVTAEREVAERQILLAREVDHRAKNVLAVVQSILRLTRPDGPQAFEAMKARVAALARAHELLARGGWGGAGLEALLREELAPYAGPGEGGRCTLHGPALRLRPEAVQPLSMVVHELATNSAKHGALSRPEGQLRIAWALDLEGGRPSRLRLHWEEAAGPAVPVAPKRRGFGSRVIAGTVERQLGGEARFDWHPEGLRCELSFPAARLLPLVGPQAEARRPGSDRQREAPPLPEVARAD